jgi:hypothetical protein
MTFFGRFGTFFLDFSGLSRTFLDFVGLLGSFGFSWIFAFFLGANQM